MSRNIKKESENDKKYTLLLSDIEGEIIETLRYTSDLETKESGVLTELKPSMFLHCKSSNFCIDRCQNSSVCRNFKEFRDFYLRYGFILYPYTVFNDGLPAKKDKIMGFHDTELKNVIFINSVCFEDKYKDDPINSALNVSFHEFLHAVANTYFEYDLLLASIDMEDYKAFASRPQYINNLLMMYDKSELISENELIHRYIANNIDTKPMLEAIYKSVTNYKPKPAFRELHIQLTYLFKKLEIDGGYNG